MRDARLAISTGQGWNDRMNDTGSGELKEKYNRYIFRKVMFVVICIVGIVAIAGFSVTIGSRDIGFFRAYELIWEHIKGTTYALGSLDWWDDDIVWNSRLPRVCMAIIAGAALAIAGAAMQSVMKNPLADPYTTGISSGAVFGVTLALVLGFTASGASQYGLVLNAFIFSLIPTGIIIMMSKFTNASPATMILAGVAVSFFFNGLTTLLMVGTDADTLANAYLWQIGTLENAVWTSIPLMFVVTLVGSAFLLFTSRQLNILSLGDDSAKSLGMDAQNYRLICMLIISFMIASIISFTGIIGFVGLVAPHIARLTLGGDNRYVIPAAMAFGALFMLAADMLARIVVYPGEMPVGIIISFVGGPIFLYLILKQKRGAL